MPRTYTLRVREQESDPPHDVEVEIPDEEAEILDSFLSYCKDLEDCRINRENLQANIHLNVDESTGLTFRTELPPWEDVQVLLHRLRPLILQQEYASFHRVKGILGRRVAEKTYRGVLRFIGDEFTGKRMRSAIEIVSNEVVMNSEKALYLWLNSHEYHRDQDKRELLETLHEILPLEWSKGVFVLLLFHKVNAIRRLAVLANLALGYQDSLQMRLP